MGSPRQLIASTVSSFVPANPQSLSTLQVMEVVLSTLFVFLFSFFFKQSLSVGALSFMMLRS